MKQTYVNIDLETHKKIKELAEKKGMKIYRLLKEILESYLKNENISLDK